jgi:hypothetical protein
MLTEVRQRPYMSRIREGKKPNYTISAVVDEEFYDKIRENADENGLRISDYMREALKLVIEMERQV